MPFYSYKSFVKFHKVRMALLLMLPFSFLGMWCMFVAYITGDMRYPVCIFVIIMMTATLAIVTPSDTLPIPWNAIPRDPSQPPRHAVDMIVRDLYRRNLLHDSFQVCLMRKEVCIPCIYVHGFERCYIMVSHNDYPLWKQGAAEAVILHEVGHAATLTARLASLRPISKLNKVLYLAMVGHLLVMAFAPSESPISFIVLFGLAFCLATVLIGLLITKPLNHSAEYVADSHIVSTAGLTGIQGFLSYFADGLKGGVGGKIISPYAKDTHPAPKDRIAALHLYVRDVLEVRTAS